MARTTDRLPPHSVEAEAAVLGCVLLSPEESMDECLTVFTSSEFEEFYDIRNRAIYETMVGLHRASKKADLITVRQALCDAGKLSNVGGDEYLAALPDATPTSTLVAQYIQEVMDKFHLRKLIHLCAGYIDKGYHPEGPAAELIALFERDALALIPERRCDTPGIKELTREAIDEIERRHQLKGQCDGLSYGFPDLDKLTGGLHPGEMTVIAAYPGVGKTTLAVNVLEHIAVDTKVPAGMFSLEMQAKSLVLRAISARARVSLRNINDGFLSERDFPKLTLAAGKVSVAPIYLDDSSDLTVTQMRAKARRMWQRYNIRLLVIDYVQLLSGGGKHDNREQEVSYISKQIKATAKELSIPVIALSQLNDDGKLRESRAIGQDADNVFMLENQDDGKHDQEQNSDGYRDAIPVDLIIKKQRNGPAPVRVHLTFLKNYTRFESAAKVSTEDYPYSPPHND